MACLPALLALPAPRLVVGTYPRFAAVVGVLRYGEAQHECSYAVLVASM